MRHPLRDTPNLLTVTEYLPPYKIHTQAHRGKSTTCWRKPADVWEAFDCGYLRVLLTTPTQWHHTVPKSGRLLSPGAFQTSLPFPVFPMWGIKLKTTQNKSYRGGICWPRSPVSSFCSSLWTMSPQLWVVLLFIKHWHSFGGNHHVLAGGCPKQPIRALLSSTFPPAGFLEANDVNLVTRNSRRYSWSQ